MTTENGNKKLIIFDFDGVLINTLNLCFEIHVKKNPWLTLEEYKDISNGNLYEKLKEFEEKKGFKNPDDFFAQYEEGVLQIDIQDILHDAILHLADNYNLVIVTSSSKSVVDNFLLKQNLNGCFSEILGYEFHTSKVVKINYLLDKHKINPKETIFITDTLGDIEEGHECQVPILAVTWGVHSKDLLQEGNPEFIIDDPNDLVVTVEKYLN